MNALITKMLFCTKASITKDTKDKILSIIAVFLKVYLVSILGILVMPIIARIEAKAYINPTKDGLT